MPRKLSGPKPGTLLRYVPAVPGDPMAVYVRAPSEAEKRQHLNDVTDVMKLDGDVVHLKFIDMFERRKKAIVGFVARVEDLLDHDGQPVTTGEQLYALGDDALLKDIAEHVESLLVLSPVEKKDSGKSPGSPPPETAPFAGTAATVAPASSAPNAIATEPMATPSSSSLSSPSEASAGAQRPG